MQALAVCSARILGGQHHTASVSVCSTLIWVLKYLGLGCSALVACPSHAHCVARTIDFESLTLSVGYIDTYRSER